MIKNNLILNEGTFCRCNTYSLKWTKKEKMRMVKLFQIKQKWNASYASKGRKHHGYKTYYTTDTNSIIKVITTQQNSWLNTVYELIKDMKQKQYLLIVDTCLKKKRTLRSKVYSMVLLKEE